MNNNSKQPTNKYLNPETPLEERVDDLLSLMTWEEKVDQLGSILPFSDWGEWFKRPLEERIQIVLDMPVDELVGTGHFSIILRELPARLAAQKANQIYQSARENTRLGIPPMIHDEGLHGLVANGATSFPQSIAMASSWNPELLEQVAGAIGRETYHRGIRQLLSPTINIARDPRCGRTEETYGEDPYLAARMAVAFVKGVQKEGVVATPKHFAANFVGDGGRDSYPIHFSNRLLREIYFPAFEAAIREGGALSIMAAYNSLDGIPCSCNSWLLTEVLRDEWGFEGYVVSDYDSVIHILEKHAVAENKTDVARKAVESGLDVELPTTNCFDQPMLEGISNGTISQQAIDLAVRRVLSVKFQLGLFDDPFVDEEKAETICNSPGHQALALRMARQGIVLLKNENNLLPLSKEIHSLAVIGPQADEIRLGGYSWYNYDLSQVVTPLRGLQELLGTSVNIHHATGCDVKDPSRAGFNDAVEAARRSQVAVLFLGNSEQTEGEQRDRASLDLPGVQVELVAEIIATDTPVVIVLINGSAITMTDWINHSSAVVEAWYPGQEGGTAIAEVLFGDVNPGGRLPVTFPNTIGQLPMYYNSKPSGRIDAYVDQTGKALFPFGHGLSYTTFEYSNMRIEPTVVKEDEIAIISFDLTNTGERDGDEVIQLYVHDVLASNARPIKELKGFQRLSLGSGKTKTVSFLLEVGKLGLYDAQMKYVVEPGEFSIMLGSSSEDIRLQGSLLVQAS